MIFFLYVRTVALSSPVSRNTRHWIAAYRLFYESGIKYIALRKLAKERENWTQPSRNGMQFAHSI